MAEYFKRFANPRTCAGVFKKMIELINEEKPCGDDGDCYANVGKKCFGRGPRERMRDKPTELNKKSKWDSIATMVEAKYRTRTGRDISFRKDNAP